MEMAFGGCRLWTPAGGGGAAARFVTCSWGSLLNLHTDLLQPASQPRQSQLPSLVGTVPQRAWEMRVKDT